MKSFLLHKISKFFYLKKKNSDNNAISCQYNILKKNIKKAKNTKFGYIHDFHNINSYHNYVNKVNINDYEKIKFYIDKIIKGEKNILWPHKPLYLAKTSGTISGVKYIPISKEGINSQIFTAKQCLLNYMYITSNINFLNGKMIFIQGSPKLECINNIKIGRLSGISDHHIPFYLRFKREPSYTTNIIEDWETKIKNICIETVNKDMRMISGIPPWLIMYFEKLIDISGKENIKTIFKDFSLMITGGVNFTPYSSNIKRLIGGKIDILQTYPASEGFIAYQDSLDRNDLSLVVNNGIFYEFIEYTKYRNNIFERLPLEGVKIGLEYVIILTTNSGLWAYNIGDIVTFTSINPYRITVVGRIGQYISAFGEHVIINEVETALMNTIDMFNLNVVDFIVYADICTHKTSTSKYIWLIEFKELPYNHHIELIEQHLDDEMRKQNIYYDDLIKGKVINKLKIKVISEGGINFYLNSIGKLGGQNKIPRLYNDNSIEDFFIKNNLIKN